MSLKPKLDVVLLAPLCRDEIVGPSGVHSHPGGVGFYASWALVGRGCRVRLHTPLADGDRDLLDGLPDGVGVVVHPSRATTRFRIEVDPSRPNQRRLVLVDACDPFDPGAIRDSDEAAYVLVGPLTPDDLSRELRDLLSVVSRPVDLGVQGLVRGVASEGVIKLRSPGELNLPPVRILAGDEEEIATFAGTNDPALAARELAARCAEEVVVTRGDRGAQVALGRTGECIEVAVVPPRRMRHTVGLGDTFLAVYGWERHAGASPSEAGARAAVAATRLMEEGCPGLVG